MRVSVAGRLRVGCGCPVRVLGLDPGLDGGAALRVSGVVVGTWAWTRVARGVRLRGPSGEVTLPSLHAVGEAIAAEVGSVDRLVAEGLYYSTRPGGRRIPVEDVLRLAEAAGEVLGPLRAIAPVVLRPLQAEWSSVLGTTGLREDVAERAAMERARIEGWLPRWTAKEQGAVAEAGAMTLWEAA